MWLFWVLKMTDRNWCPVKLRCIDQPMVAWLNRSIKSAFSSRPDGSNQSIGRRLQPARSRYGAAR